MITKITFNKGWNELRVCDQPVFIQRALEEVFHLTTNSSFYVKMRHQTPLTAVEYFNLQALFKEYGVDEPFEFVTE